MSRVTLEYRSSIAQDRLSRRRQSPEHSWYQSSFRGFAIRGAHELSRQHIQVLQGDMIVPEDQLSEANATTEKGEYRRNITEVEDTGMDREKRQVMTGHGYPRTLWTPGVPIAYRFDSSIGKFLSSFFLTPKTQIREPAISCDMRSSSGRSIAVCLSRKMATTCRGFASSEVKAATAIWERPLGTASRSFPSATDAKGYAQHEGLAATNRIVPHRHTRNRSCAGNVSPPFAVGSRQVHNTDNAEYESRLGQTLC